MKIKKTAGICLLFVAAVTTHALALTPVKDSAEDLFWSKPMTVHDYKKETDLHNVAVSAMAITELEFVRLGDGILGLVARNKKSPISRSLDSLEYAYSRLPRIMPVRRFGQLWDALQLRQLSLSDARLATSLVAGNNMVGITPLMQVRVYKLVILVEDIIYDVDRMLMTPVNWGVSSIRKKPVHLKSLGYVGDGVGYCRWKISVILKRINREVVRVGSKIVDAVEKSHDAHIRRKRRKQNEQMSIYAKMPLSVFLEHKRYFQSKKHPAAAATLEDWRDHMDQSTLNLPDNIHQAHIPTYRLAPSDPAKEVIVTAPYALWRKTPRELKKYAITSEELAEIMAQHGFSSSPKIS